MGQSLQQLVRQHLEALAGERSGDEAADALFALMDDETPGRSGGRRIRREEAYEGRP